MISGRRRKNLLLLSKAKQKVTVLFTDRGMNKTQIFPRQARGHTVAFMRRVQDAQETNGLLGYDVFKMHRRPTVSLATTG